MPSILKSDQVSPTAHYTGMVWARHGLSHPAFATLEGRLMFNAARPSMALIRAAGGPTLEGLLLARHRVIDLKLHAAINAGRISQVIEIAAGLSPRGWRFAHQYGGRITYIEADLPGMAARKRAVLASIDAGNGPGHQVLDIDAFAESGPASLAGIAATLDPTKGTAIITEGLINYFPAAAVLSLWARMAETLSRFPQGLYLSDLHIGGENQSIAVRSFVQLLSIFVRGRVYLHFGSANEAEQSLIDAGFDGASLHKPADYKRQFKECRDPAAKLVRVIEATIRSRAGKP